MVLVAPTLSGAPTTGTTTMSLNRRRAIDVVVSALPTPPPRTLSIGPTTCQLIVVFTPGWKSAGSNDEKSGCPGSGGACTPSAAAHAFAAPTMLGSPR